MVNSVNSVLTETGELFLGTAREILSLYRNLDRRGIALPVFAEQPRFNMGKYYGLAVDTYDTWEEAEISPVMHVIAGDQALAIVQGL